MFGKGMYLYIFFFNVVLRRYQRMCQREQVSEDIDPELNEEEDVIMEDSMEEH